jgi:hypothetical protein
MSGKATTNPDNNKRLAALESGVSALALTLAANGFTLEEGADPLEAAIGAIKGQAAKIDELETNASSAAIAAVARADKAEAALGELEPKVEAVVDYLCANHPDKVSANECALTTATRILGEQSAEIVELKTDVQDLTEQLEADADRDALAEEVAVSRERPEGARDFGPTGGALDAAELAALIEKGEAFELSFSNGEYEIVELAPVALPASDIVQIEGRRLVGTPVFVRGGERAEELDGVALVYGGEQVAYCQFPKPIMLEANQERRFERAIAFG